MIGPRLLDLFSGAGGAGTGYCRAGFEVVGVDISSQPRYPFRFIQADAFKVLADRRFLTEFDVIHASPPCQAYTIAQRLRDNEHPDLIGLVRQVLKATGMSWVIENVPGSPLRDPVILCGTMLGLRTYRHRLFESSIPIAVPRHPEHVHDTVKMGRPVKNGDWYHAVGNFSGVEYVRQDLGVLWMTRDEIRECVPPIYTEFIGRQLLADAS